MTTVNRHLAAAKQITKMKDKQSKVAKTQIYFSQDLPSNQRTQFHETRTKEDLKFLKLRA